MRGVVGAHKRVIAAPQVLFEAFFSMALCWSPFIWLSAFKCDCFLLLRSPVVLWGCHGRHPPLSGCNSLLISHFTKTRRRKNTWNLLFWLSVLHLFSWCFYLFIYLSTLFIYLYYNRGGGGGEWQIVSDSPVCPNVQKTNYIKKRRHRNHPELGSKTKTASSVRARPHRAFCGVWYLQNLQCTVGLE